MIAVPDHWHALAYTEAARQKKDIYGEKPLAKTIAEQQAIVRAVEQNNIIWQTGSWRRSQASYRRAAEIVRNGLIGKVKQVEVGLLDGHIDFLSQFGGGDDEFRSLASRRRNWITKPGSARPKCSLTSRPASTRNWRWNYNTGGGMLMDWIGHFCDIAHWGMDADRSGPSEIEGHGEFPPKGRRLQHLHQIPHRTEVSARHPHDHCRAAIQKLKTKAPSGSARTAGSSPVKAGFECSKPEFTESKNLPDELRKVKLYESPGHVRNFLDCVKSRKPTVAPVETGHHSAIPGHLGLISMLTGRKIHWDVAEGRNHRRCRSQQTAHPRIPRAVEAGLIVH